MHSGPGPPPYAGGNDRHRPSCSDHCWSTSVRRGKSTRSASLPRDGAVHPRTPGEKEGLTLQSLRHTGPPPYAGGKGRDCLRDAHRHRSTPVRRGKRTTSLRRGEPTAVHPRTPGEKAVIPRALWDSVGPPPHAGGKRLQGRSLRCKSRSTLARRGKTMMNTPEGRKFAVHPRTPGKTSPTLPNSRTSAVHPRMPGENVDRDPGHQLCLGPPPHAGGKLRCSCSQSLADRSTPARRGKTLFFAPFPPCLTVHPRTPGENRRPPMAPDVLAGPPPHAGGKQPESDDVDEQARSTPARRGKTLTMAA